MASHPRREQFWGVSGRRDQPAPRPHLPSSSMESGCLEFPSRTLHMGHQPAPSRQPDRDPRALTPDPHCDRRIRRARTRLHGEVPVGGRHGRGVIGEVSRPGPPAPRESTAGLGRGSSGHPGTPPPTANGDRGPAGPICSARTSMIESRARRNWGFKFPQLHPVRGPIRGDGDGLSMTCRHAARRSRNHSGADASK